MIRSVTRCPAPVFVALFLAAFVALATDASSAKTEISFWGPLDGTRQQVMEDIIAQFHEAYPDIEVKLVVTAGWDGTYEKTLVSIAAGTGPDIVRIRSNMLPGLVQKGLAADLTPYLDRKAGAFLEDFFPPLLAGVSYGNTYRALPINSNTRILFYNKDHLAQAGIGGPPTTFAEWVDTSAKLSDIDGGRVGTTFGANEFGFTFLLANGAEIVDPETGLPAIDSPVAVDTLQFVMDNVGTAFFPSFIKAYKGYKLEDGAAAMKPAAVFQANKIDQVLGDDHAFGATMIPAGKAGQISAVYSQVLSIISASDDKDAAWKFVRFLFEPEISMRWHVGMNYPPVRRSIMIEPVFLDHWAWPVFAEQLAKGKPLPLVPGMYRIETKIKETFEDVLINQGNPAEALTNLSQTIRGILQDEGALPAQ